MQHDQAIGHRVKQVMLMGKRDRKPYKIRLVPTDGDPEQIIKELVEEKIQSVLHKRNAFFYNDSRRNQATGVIRNDSKK
ncbi:MAG: hypothetical protein BAA01_09305 [Bacillus thermozeamaize]|uniref:Uncharacterized protein n=1 Tax=Bacillus thermozeamaize TaxID=230954 RepID=A0A1Y3PKN7_9BACI|nr:MAG: hypothetical protein BAA01_09305 [Bacillus thermozeamaize]